MEEPYVTIFSSSSDSVHTGAEDIYNRTFLEFIPEDYKVEQMKGILNEKASFAIFLTICSLIHAINSLTELCGYIKESSWYKEADDIGIKILELKNEHEEHNSSRA